MVLLLATIGSALAGAVLGHILVARSSSAAAG